MTKVSESTCLLLLGRRGICCIFFSNNTFLYHAVPKIKIIVLIVKFLIGYHRKLFVYFFSQFLKVRIHLFFHEM